MIALNVQPGQPLELAPQPPELAKTGDFPQLLEVTGIVREHTSAYVNTVENCFVEIRGRGVHWSPVDAARALAWYALGVPAGTTVRVLHARVQAWRFRHGQSARLPMHLGWYEPAVLEHSKHLRRLGEDDLLEMHHPGPETVIVHAPPDKTTLTGLIAELTELLPQTTHPAVKHVYGKAFDHLDGALHGVAADVEPHAELQPQGTPDLPLVVEKCRSRMTKLLQAGLNNDQRLALQRELEEARETWSSLSRKALKMREERVIDRFLARQFAHHVPTLTGWKPASALFQQVP